MRILSIGEILWDVFPTGAEHLGGAPLNLAAHARRMGEDVIFLSAVGADSRGQRALARLLELGLPATYVQTVNSSPTGWVSVEVDNAGQPSFTIHRPAAYDSVALANEQLASIQKWRPDWICFGTLQQTAPQARSALDTLLAYNPQARRFYDVNLRAGCYTPRLVEHLLASADTVKLNQQEVAEVAAMLKVGFASWEEFCRKTAQRFHWRAVCVTLGAHGCAMLSEGIYTEHPGYPIKVADTIGAGDAFSAALLHGLGRAWPGPQIAEFANRVGALVASRPGAIPEWTLKEVHTMPNAHGAVSD